MNKKQKMKQEKEMMRQGQEILGQISEGKSTREILTEIYLDAFPEKTVREAVAVADTILIEVAKFDRDYAMAQKNLDGFLDEALDRMGKGMNRTERCVLWLKLAATVDEMGESENGAVSEEKMASYIRRITVMDSEATEEFEARTKQDAKKALLRSGFVVSGMLQSAEELEKISESDEAAKLLVDLGSEELEYRAIVAMLVYTKARNGEADDILREFTPEQLTTQVCAEIEKVRIAEAIENGTLQRSTGRALVRILGCITLLAAAIASIVLGMDEIPKTTLQIENGEWTIADDTSRKYLESVGLIAVVAEVFTKAVEIWGKKSDAMMDAVLAIPGKVANGLRRLSPASYAEADDMREVPGSVDEYTPLYKERIRATEEETADEEEDDTVMYKHNGLFV